MRSKLLAKRLNKQNKDRIYAEHILENKICNNIMLIIWIDM